MLWSALFTTPLMIGIQIVSARLGRVTGQGLAANIREHFPAPLLYSIVGLLVVANTFNIAADLGAMGSAFEMLLGADRVIVIVVALLSLAAGFIPSRAMRRSSSAHSRVFAYVETSSWAPFGEALEGASFRICRFARNTSPLWWRCWARPSARPFVLAARRSRGAARTPVTIAG